MLKKIIAAGPGRKSRLHDEKGNFVGFHQLFLNGPRAILTGVLRIVFHYRPELPWISYSAIYELGSFLTKSSRVLEFGSGMLTIWYAKHAGEVYSVEDSKPWFEKIGNFIKNNNISNINLTFSSNLNDYSQFMSNDHAGFDLVMVDGNYRSSCVSHAIRLLRPGGVFYLDNSDRGVTSNDSDTRLAEEVILQFAQEKKAKVIYFTDFAPGTFFVQQGLMIKLPGQAR